MAYFTTGRDLKLDALDLAGEPMDGTSEYDDTVYELLTAVERSLISGGILGAKALDPPPPDWHWARAWPRGTILLEQPFNNDSSTEATFILGNRDVTINTVGADLPDLAGWRIFTPDTPARQIIETVTNTPGIYKTVTLRDIWIGQSGATNDWMAYPDTYELPEDFVRGLSPLFIYAFPSNLPMVNQIDLVDPGTLERMYPQTFPWGSSITQTSGIPVLAARVTESRLRFSHFLNSPDQLPVMLEFEYMRQAPVIAEGTIPIVPIHHRRILSYGAAYLILDDKDDTASESLYARFVAQYRAMSAEMTRDARRMSSLYGVVQPARHDNRQMVRLTETGLPVVFW